MDRVLRRRGADNRQIRRRFRLDAGTETSFHRARRSRSKKSRRNEFLRGNRQERRAWYLNLVESYFTAADEEERELCRTTIREECGVQPYDFVNSGDPVIDCRNPSSRGRTRHATYDDDHLYAYPAPRYDQFGPPHFVSDTKLHFRGRDGPDVDQSIFYFLIPIAVSRAAARDQQFVQVPFPGDVVKLWAPPKKPGDGPPTHILQVSTSSHRPPRNTAQITGKLLKYD